jgi:hypothetical protein
MDHQDSYLCHSGVDWPEGNMAEPASVHPWSLLVSSGPVLECSSGQFSSIKGLF